MAYPSVPLSMTDWYPWLQTVARAINFLLNREIASTFTMTASAATTILYDNRIGGESYIDLIPTTSNASSLEGMGWYVTNQVQGQATINHANSSFSDRTYRVIIRA